ncbi:MAG: RNA polymerase sigma factor [Crocinitomicaceae bacterium]
MEKIEKLKHIVEGCLNNNRRSQETLFQMFYGKMLSVCMRYISDRDTAQEVLQEGFIKVFDKLEGFDFKGSFEGWVRRIIVNTAIDSIRKAKRAPILKDDDNDFKMEASNKIEETEKVELIELKAEIALEAVQKLSPGYRTVFNLFVIEEYSHKEIAEILGISEGTSKSNLSKAKKNLKHILTEEFSNIRE